MNAPTISQMRGEPDTDRIAKALSVDENIPMEFLSIQI